MRIVVEGESAETLLEGSRKKEIAPSEQLRRAIALLAFLEDQELAGRRVLVEDTEAGTIRRLLVSEKSELEVEDHLALWSLELEN